MGGPGFSFRKIFRGGRTGGLQLLRLIGAFARQPMRLPNATGIYKGCRAAAWGSGAVSRPDVSERLPVPFTFKPRLSAFEAFVQIFASLCRIFLGCLLFAGWGVFALYLWGV
jgi:hypothetical protein